ncbi:hypothetical protein [Herbaspirillum robiniae]|uniref:Uncharacterized protein n=1 Tax=Herbaspirillum robiniae TaxID=2014887 RepID=A0A246WR27_9BURK|nr:hypothetical protein [Herbaspirillum robiniae]OWY28824.1 hypothetical protein CEJ42_12690 [Herbaspirillum robiniae]
MTAFLYEHKTNDAEFIYRLWYSHHAEGWAVDSAQILRRGETLLPKRPLKGTHLDASGAIAYGVRWCETISAYLEAQDFSTDEWAERLLEGTKTKN